MDRLNHDHRSVFAVWHWRLPSWWFCLAVPLALATPVPVERALDAIGSPRQIIAVTDLVYGPAWWAADNSVTVYSFFVWQDEFMVKVYGPPKKYRKCGLWIDVGNLLVRLDLRVRRKFVPDRTVNRERWTRDLRRVD